MAMSELDRTTIVEMASALAAGDVSARELAERHLARVESLNPSANAVLEINPDALDTADALDEERRRSGPRSPLHGIPIMVKDNLDTADKMPTTAGSLALAHTHANEDSTVVAKLRAAGAVLLGKTNLSEWANFRSTRSSSGWSSVGGQVRNAYDRARTPGGSSSGSGVAVALGFCAAAIGTETDGSVVGPSAMNGIVGIKPTVGLVSRAGIIPISASQDTAGPMARTVRDAALLLSAIVGVDARDESTAQADHHAVDFTLGLDAATLNGRRLGVARSYAGYNDRLDSVLERAIGELREAGAIVIDPIELTPADDIRPTERLVMQTEFKAGLNAYLATRVSNSCPANLQAIIDFNLANIERAMPHFAQETLEASQLRGRLDDPEYIEARATSLRLAGKEGIDAALERDNLDAIICPTSQPAWFIDWINGDNRKGGASTPAAVAGYPHVTVPMGFVEHLPVGLSFFSGAYSDAELIKLAHAYEQITKHRKSPPS